MTIKNKDGEKNINRHDVTFGFPVGYHQLHFYVSLNFQMNHFYNWVGDPQMLDEMRAVSSRIDNCNDFIREFLALAEYALTNGQQLKSAICAPPPNRSASSLKKTT